MGSEAVVAYCVAIGAVLGFAVYAFTRSYQRRKVQEGDTEEFITARGQVKTWRVAWSFYASLIGAWTMVTPPNFAVIAGVLGVVSYSISSGIPILLIAAFGHHIQAKFPHVLSLGDFVGYRFGKLAQTYIVILCTFNMIIAMLAEFTTIGSLVSDYLGLPAIPVILIVGVLTMLYTTVGGLYISIVTDQIQGIASIILMIFLSSYIAVTFQYTLPPELPPQIGPTAAGYSSLVSMPLSMVGSTILSEAVWQRVWASENRRALNVGASIAALGVIVLVFFTSFCGFLAYWAGLITPETNENLYFFTLLASRSNQDNNVIVNSWAGVLSMVLAVTMNESAVDSYQNGLVASIGGYFLKGKNVQYVRLSVLLFNVPVVALATLNFNVLDLYLLTDLLCSTSSVPVLFGVYEGKYQKQLDFLFRNNHFLYYKGIRTKMAST
eukprot:TRINITY_DN9106_c0_g1_i1.p1 TRINITY_DN9106_c0_g1~~TRINITY_DN9106_c0_g1_i1.p1  ORF type:complete len:493 (+),score=20.88 TRINITY_DN9106_c0_g1_i1:170-1480(+)